MIGGALLAESAAFRFNEITFLKASVCVPLKGSSQRGLCGSRDSCSAVFLLFNRFL